MIDRDKIATPNLPNFEDVVNSISELVPPHKVSGTDEYGEIEYPGWDGTITTLDLEPEVASEAGLGDTVRARVIGDYLTGVAVILRSRNLFDTRRYGFWIQPTQVDDGLRDFEMWQAPAKKPKRGEAYWGFELLDRTQAEQSSPLVSRGLINSLQQMRQ